MEAQITRHRNSIHSIEDKNGEVICDPCLISSKSVPFFSDLQNSQDSENLDNLPLLPKCINDFENELLTKVPSEDDIKHIVW